MFRPQSANTRADRQLREKSLKRLETTTDPIERLRLLCLTRGASGIIGLGREFRRMDDDGSKQLNWEEFQNGIYESGLKKDEMSVEELKGAFDRFDIDNSGSVSYEEFLRALRPPLSESRLKLIDEAFKKMDKSGDGQVTLEDVKNVYSVKSHPEFMNGEKSEDQILNKFLANFEKGSVTDGIVTKDEFLDYYTGVSASIDLDSYFDLMMRNAWKL
uniref:EF-hand domain-containing protein n=1 Tax=Strigamia maritima TaxID=126957 RepID=T1JNW3_STRMM